MSFNIERFGSDASNVKSILGGVCYYRYFNKDNNDVTVAGYFPASLGLQLGDRITVIPATKTNADEEYIVTDITNRIVTVTKVEAGGSVDTSKVVNADTLPTASADNLGYVYLYTGTTDASYTHGYIYECIATPVYDSTVQFNPATLSGTTAACSGSDFAALVAQWGSGAIDTIIKGTLTYDESGELLVFVGQDDTDTTVCTFQLYVQDYVDAGFTFTGTFQDGDVIAFTCTIEETGATYAWVRQDVQPQPAKELPTQAGNSGKFLKTNGVSASWGSISALQNTATGNNSLTIGGVPTTQDQAINIGAYSETKGINGFALGGSAEVYNDGAIAIGARSKAGLQNSLHSDYWDMIAIGNSAEASATGAIQIGYGANSETKTLKIGMGFVNGQLANYKLLNTDGTIPADRLASTSGLADGNYRLRLTIASGVPTLTWVAE